MRIILLVLMLSVNHVVLADDNKDSIGILEEVAVALGAAGDALVKITDGVKHLISTGVDGYDFIAARRERQSLISLSARLSHLARNTNAYIVFSIDEYLADPSPSIDDWEIVTSALNEAIVEVTALLRDVNEQRNDFILESSYSKLQETLSSRVMLLNRLRSLPPPITKEEKTALRRVNEKYKILISNLEEAIVQFNAYLSKKRT